MAHQFDTRAEASRAAADHIADRLKHRLDA
jgi:hypothetical protein